MVLMEDNIRPIFSIAEAKQTLQQHYDIQTQNIIELSAELDRNFYIVDDTGDEYVLKIAHTSLSDSVLDLQNATLNHLASTVTIVPKLIPTLGGTNTAQITSVNQQTYTLRLLN